MHPNGQPRADAPSRLRRADAERQIIQWLRQRIKAGDSVALAANPSNTVFVKRVNEKTLTDDAGDKWEFTEVIPLIDGAPMTSKQMAEAFTTWKDQQEAAPAAPDQTPAAPAPVQTVEFVVDNLVTVANRIGILNVDPAAMELLRKMEGKYKITIEAIPAA